MKAGPQGPAHAPPTGIWEQAHSPRSSAQLITLWRVPIYRKIPILRKGYLFSYHLALFFSFYENIVDLQCCGPCSLVITGIPRFTVTSPLQQPSPFPRHQQILLVLSSVYLDTLSPQPSLPFQTNMAVSVTYHPGECKVPWPGLSTSAPLSQSILNTSARGSFKVEVRVYNSSAQNLEWLPIPFTATCKALHLCSLHSRLHSVPSSACFIPF